LIPVGELIPNVEIMTPAGEQRRLSEVVVGPTLLLFLRHLA
jgi:hypothetical protein